MNTSQAVLPSLFLTCLWRGLSNFSTSCM
jgi:hypothetical protein